MAKPKYVLTLAFLGLSLMASAGRRAVYNVNVERPLNATDASELTIPVSLIKSAFGYGSQTEIISALNGKNIQILASYMNNGKETFYSTYTADEGFGHWFNAKGQITNKAKYKFVCVSYDGTKFSVIHDAGNVTAESQYTVYESFVSKSAADTVTYKFNIKVGGSNMSITSDQGNILFSRKDMVDSWLVKPSVTVVKAGKTYNENFVQANEGESVILSASMDESIGTAKYSWLDRNGKTIRGYKNAADFTLSDLKKSDAGLYYLKARIAKTDGGVVVREYKYFLDVQDKPGEFYDWPANTKKFGYNFRDEYPSLEEPQKIHNIKKKNGKPANMYVGKWWSCFWGDNLNPLVGMDSATVYTAAKNMVEYFDEEFAYIRDVMGWPPDDSPKNGFKSYIYIFGSGLNLDSTDSITKGGYQGSYNVDGRNYTCVTCSYYPFACFRADADTKKIVSDGPSQRSAMIHEGIHSVLANMAGAKGSDWFQEAGNTWLQGRMATLRNGSSESDDARAGWLDGGPFIAPFMPIECYSGWLQDGSFGGPGAQGVNMYNGGQQICTWRKYLGGTQYGNSFPYILASFCGDGSIPWIWRYCTGCVLEGIGDSIGDDAMRKIILQYRSRMAIYDFGVGYKSYRNICSDNFGGVIGPEWEPYWIKCADWKMTPYAKPVLNDEDGWMAPDTLTNPGWSGANFIPIHVDKNKNRVEVEFRPEDTNMMAQLCYRTSNGTAYYSQPVICGTLSLDISDRPANGVVILVVANTDYIYTGDKQRAHHWDYRIRLGDGAMAVADQYQKWFFHEKTIVDKDYEAYITGIEKVETTENDNQRPLANNDDAWYDLQGRKVAAPTHGIFIHNGKKTFVK